MQSHSAIARYSWCQAYNILLPPPESAESHFGAHGYSSLRRDAFGKDIKLIVGHHGAFVAKVGGFRQLSMRAVAPKTTALADTKAPSKRALMLKQVYR
jgi:hypothetical protein